MTQVSTLIQEVASPMASAAPSTTPNVASGYLRRAASGSAERTTNGQAGEEGSPSVTRAPGTGGVGGRGTGTPSLAYPDSTFELTWTGPSPG
jgi:hypothetical protein